MADKQIQKVRAWHEDLLEFIIANPRASTQETAFYFNVSESWISIVKNSDAFQELWASRRGEHFSRVSATVVEKVTALAEISVDALTDKVVNEVNSGNANIQTLKEVGELALKSLGFGGQVRQAGFNQVNNNNTNIIVADRDTLREAREKMAKLRQERVTNLEGINQESLPNHEGSGKDGNGNGNGNGNGENGKDGGKSLEGEILYPSEKFR